MKRHIVKNGADSLAFELVEQGVARGAVACQQVEQVAIRLAVLGNGRQSYVASVLERLERRAIKLINLATPLLNRIELLELSEQECAAQLARQVRAAEI